MRTIESIIENYDIIEYDNRYHEHNLNVEHLKLAMKEYAKEACEEQRRLCAEAAEIHDWYYGETNQFCTNSIINKQSILNCKSPIE